MNEKQPESFPDKFDRIVKRLMGYSKPRDPRKEENPIFATFQDRLIASVLDIGLIYLLFQDVFRSITAKVYSYAGVAAVDARMAEAPPNNVDVTEQIRYVVETMFETGLAQLWIINSVTQALLVGVLLVFSWQEFHLTPGKFIIGLEFAGRNGEGRPTLRQYILRFAGFFLSMPIFMIGFAALGLDKQKRAWHDRIAGTTVIYSQRGSIFRQAWDLLKSRFKK